MRSSSAALLIAAGVVLLISIKMAMAGADALTASSARSLLSSERYAKAVFGS